MNGAQEVSEVLQMSVLDQIKERAKSKNRRVVLPEGTEPRAVAAAAQIVAEQIAEVTLIGDPKVIKSVADENSADITKAEIIYPRESKKFNDFVADFMELRKRKNLSRDKAEEAIASPLFFGAMMVRHNLADASVAGSVNTTGDVLRAAIQVIGLKQGINTVSSCFMMTVPEYLGEEYKVFLYADGAVVPNPTSEQLASIAMSTAETMRNLLGMQPNVAFLSFSTKGSASHEDVSKVREAVKILEQMKPDFPFDGELQVDAAIVPKVGASKAPGSPVGGKANILIFPDLDAGNIAYKLTQRLAKATATGPIIQGLAKPANDLSRGCSAQDIVDVTAIATLMKG